MEELKPANMTDTFNMNCEISNELQDVIHPLHNQHRVYN